MHVRILGLRLNLVQTVASHFLSWCSNLFRFCLLCFPLLFLPIFPHCSLLLPHTILSVPLHHSVYFTITLSLYHFLFLLLPPPLATTPSLPTPVSNPSALSSTETCPIETSRRGQGSFQSPLPPTVPITYTPRGTTPNPAPTPTPTAAGSSQFASGPITPMPDYMSMATPWLKVT